jgi:hypothetical protein
MRGLFFFIYDFLLFIIGDYRLPNMSVPAHGSVAGRPPSQDSTLSPPLPSSPISLFVNPLRSPSLHLENSRFATGPSLSILACISILSPHRFETVLSKTRFKVYWTEDTQSRGFRG